MMRYITKLKKIEQKYSDILEKYGIVYLTSFKILIDTVRTYIKLVVDNRVELPIKFFCYAKTKNDVITFCESLAKNHNIPILNLGSDILNLMDEVLDAYI